MVPRAPNQDGQIRITSPSSSSRDSPGAPTAALYTSSRPAHGAASARIRMRQIRLASPSSSSRGLPGHAHRRAHVHLVRLARPAHGATSAAKSGWPNQDHQPVELLPGRAHRRAVHLVQACTWCRKRQIRRAKSGWPARPAPRATPRARPPPRCTPRPGLRMVPRAPNQDGQIRITSPSSSSPGTPTAALYTSSKLAHVATSARSGKAHPGSTGKPCLDG